MTSQSEMNPSTEGLKQHSQVKLFDEKDDLQLYSYTNTTGEFPEECRGLVYKGDKIVLKTFPFTPQYSVNDTEKLNEIFQDQFENFTFFESHEGSIIRLSYLNDKWYVSTHKKLDAFQSRWSSKRTFGDLFVDSLQNEYNVNRDFMTRLGQTTEVFESFLNILDTSKVYVFLLRNNNDNRIVCDPPDYPTVYHVGTFIGDEFSLTEQLDIPYPNKLSFTNSNELLDYVENIDYTKHQGVVVFKDNIVCKVMNSNYNRMFSIRGNESDIRFRYLQLRSNTEKTNELYHLYPRFVELFDDCEETIFKIAKWIMEKYVDRFIRKQYVTVPRDEYNIIKLCHTWHMEDRKRNRISIRKIRQFIDTQDPDSLYRMFKRYKHNQTQNHFVPQFRDEQERRCDIGSSDDAGSE